MVNGSSNFELEDALEDAVAGLCVEGAVERATPSNATPMSTRRFTFWAQSSESQYVAADAQHQDQNSLDSTSMGRDAAMQTLLAEAYAEFDLHDVEASVLRSCCAVPYGHVVHTAQTAPCAKTRYKMYMARMYSCVPNNAKMTALSLQRGGGNEWLPSLQRGGGWRWKPSIHTLRMGELELLMQLAAALRSMAASPRSTEVVPRSTAAGSTVAHRVLRSTAARSAVARSTTVRSAATRSTMARSTAEGALGGALDGCALNGSAPSGGSLGRGAAPDGGAIGKFSSCYCLLSSADSAVL